MKRTVPNLPAALTHHLRRSLAIDSTTAMRVALLYGDLEWQAEGASELHWSARDYARRQGFSRNTVRADLERLQRVGAISVAQDGSEICTYRLHGLGVPSVGGGSHVEPPEDSDPGSILEPPGSLSEPPPGSRFEPPPGSPAEPPLAHALSHPLAQRVSHIRKEESKERKKRRGKRAIRLQRIHSDSRGSSTSGLSKAQRHPAAGTAAPMGQVQPQGHEQVEGQPQGQGELQPQGPASAAEASNHEELLAGLLACFQRHCPAEWSAPQALSLTGSRRARLRRALEHAGGSAELFTRLERALAQVPPWFRSTYPQLPDGSRRPSHQFFDLLFRAAAHERDAGPEAWHLFAWSERIPAQPRAGESRQESDAGCPAAAAQLERALALLAWDGHHWRGQGVEALQLSRSEKRRLAERLEEAGYGQKGTAARQYAEPDPQQPGS